LLLALECLTKELADHQRLTLATEVEVCFCDPQLEVLLAVEGTMIISHRSLAGIAARDIREFALTPTPKSATHIAKKMTTPTIATTTATTFTGGALV
jgi:hypothetical protein